MVIIMTTKSLHHIIIEEEVSLILEVNWNINYPNNLSSDEIIQEFVYENYGDKEYQSYEIGDLEINKIGYLEKEENNCGKIK